MDIITMLKEIAETPCYKVDIFNVLNCQPAIIQEIFAANDSQKLREVIGGGNFADRTTIFNF